MMVSYRMNGAAGTMMLTGQDDLQICFNRVAQKLIADGWLRADYSSRVRYEGRVKIGRKNYPAISQAGLIVLADGPSIPDTIELRT